MKHTGVSESDKIAAAALLVLLAPMIALHAWTLSIMWSWFVVPLGVKPVGVAHAVGLTLVALSVQRSPRDDDDADKWAAVARGFVRPLIALAFGWVAKSFMVPS